MKSLELGQTPGRPEQRKGGLDAQMHNTPCLLGSRGPVGHCGKCAPQGVFEDRGPSVHESSLFHRGKRKSCWAFPGMWGQGVGYKRPEGTRLYIYICIPCMSLPCHALMSGYFKKKVQKLSWGGPQALRTRGRVKRKGTGWTCLSPLGERHLPSHCFFFFCDSSTWPSRITIHI